MHSTVQCNYKFTLQFWFVREEEGKKLNQEKDISKQIQNIIIIIIIILLPYRWIYICVR